MHLIEHSHKKWKDCLEGSLERVLFAAELEFPKILVPRLPQNSSNVNTECVGKSKQLYSLCDQLLGALIYLQFIIQILIFLIDCNCCNYVIYGYSSLRTTPGVITIQELHTGGKALLQLLLKIGSYMTIWKGILKTKLCIFVDYSYLPEFFNMLAIGQKYLSIYSPYFFNIHRVGHLHKYEAVLWTLEKLRRNNFLWQNDQCFTKEVEILRKHVF